MFQLSPHTINNKHLFFNKSKRNHILIITNHGCHSPIISVAPDTGGQNFYVNDLSKLLIKIGYKVTILNRGGYIHPITKKQQKGIVYYDETCGKLGNFCRIIYLEDKVKEFIKKENLKKHNFLQEIEFLFQIAKKIDLDFRKIYFINSHYWDGGILGLLINNKLEKKFQFKIPHIWTSHSLGILKKENLSNASKKIIRSLNFPTRIKSEERVIKEVDGVVLTSSKIKQVLLQYKAEAKNHFWFPPGINEKIYKPRKINQCQNGIRVLRNALRITKALSRNKKEVINQIKRRTIFLEVSRTARSKQKDMVLKSFAKIKNRDKALLIMTLNVDTEGVVYNEIIDIYNKLKYKDNIILIDRFLSVKEIAELFSLSHVYFSAALMEGWGMAVQEAASSGCAVIASKNIPFVNEVLKNNALVVRKNYPSKYAEKIDFLIENPRLRKKLAQNNYKLVTSNYSWGALTKKLINDLKEKNILKN